MCAVDGEFVCSRMPRFCDHYNLLHYVTISPIIVNVLFLRNQKYVEPLPAAPGRPAQPSATCPDGPAECHHKPTMTVTARPGADRQPGRARPSAVPIRTCNSL